jgi:hypothetical protein
LKRIGGVGKTSARFALLMIGHDNLTAKLARGVDVSIDNLLRIDACNADDPIERAARADRGHANDRRTIAAVSTAAV